MKKILFTFFFLIRFVFAQVSSPLWFFGNQAGLDFTSGSPVPFTNKRHLFFGASTVQNDRNGNLLYYTNGSDSAADRIRNPYYRLINSSKGSYCGFFNADNSLLSQSDSVCTVFNLLNPSYSIRSSKSDSLYFVFHSIDAYGIGNPKNALIYSKLRIDPKSKKGYFLYKEKNIQVTDIHIYKT